MSHEDVGYEDAKRARRQGVAEGFTESHKTASGTAKLSVEDKPPLFVAAMRREPRKTGLF